MSKHTVCYHQDAGFIEIRYSGQFTVAAFLKIIGEIKESALFATARGVLWDIRDADISEMKFNDISEIHARQNPESRPAPRRVATIILSELDSHVMKLWSQGIGDPNGIERRWFYAREEAIAWICAPLDRPASGQAG